MNTIYNKYERVMQAGMSTKRATSMSVGDASLLRNECLSSRLHARNPNPALPVAVPSLFITPACSHSRWQSPAFSAAFSAVEVLECTRTRRERHTHTKKKGAERATSWGLTLGLYGCGFSVASVHSNKKRATHAHEKEASGASDVLGVDT